MGNLLGRLLNAPHTPHTPRALPLNAASISSVSQAVHTSTSPSIRASNALEALATFDERAKVAKRKLEQQAQIKKLKAKIKKERKKGAYQSNQQEVVVKDKKKKKKAKSSTAKGQSGKKVQKVIKKGKKESKSKR